MNTQINRIVKSVEQRESSMNAWLDSEKIKGDHYRKILKTMIFLNKPVTGKTISHNCELSYHQIMRRLKELESLHYIHAHSHSDEPRKPILWALVRGPQA